MNISVKKHIPVEVRRNIISSLAVIFTFIAIYFSLLFAVTGANTDPKAVFLQKPFKEEFATVKKETASPEQKLPLDAVFKRDSPLYITDAENEHSAEALNGLTIPVYFHENSQGADMPLEEYVLGALLAEMPTSYDIEALKAQAVACRTYALYKQRLCSPHSGGHAVCTDYAHCQSYKDPKEVSAERLETAKSAVEQTKGIIMIYEGQPILAVFHAASVGSTLSSAQVWGGELPYLVPVKTSEDAFMNVTKKKGHGVGMSQYGAQCLAAEGYDFYAILSHYYTGVEFGSAE